MSKKRKITAGSSPAAINAVNLFAQPSTQVQIENSRWIHLNLQNTLTDQGPFLFRVYNDVEYLLLNKNYIIMEMRILKQQADQTWTPIKAKKADNTDYPMVGPIQMLGKTFFKTVKLTLNGTEVYDSGPLYAYRVYLENELSMGSDAKDAFLQSACYHRDNIHVDSERNEGFINRATNFIDGEWVQIAGTLHMDLAMQPRMLLNTMDIKIELFRNSDEFCLLNYDVADTTHYKIELRKMELCVKALSLYSGVSNSLSSVLTNHAAQYPMIQTECKSIYISAGRTEAPENNIFTDKVPKRVVVGFVENSAFNGSIRKSPFKFDHFNITEIHLSANGRQYPAYPYALDFSKKHCMRAYINMFEGLGMANSDKGNCIDFQRFCNGWTFFVFNLSPSEDDMDGFELIRQGTTSLHVRFSTPVPTPGIEAIIRGDFDSMLQITHDRTTLIDGKIGV